MATLGDTLILRTKCIHLWGGDGRDFGRTGSLLKVPLPVFFLLSFKSSFQIPFVERQGAQPQMSEPSFGFI